MLSVMGFICVVKSPLGSLGVSFLCFELLGFLSKNLLKTER